MDPNAEKRGESWICAFVLMKLMWTGKEMTKDSNRTLVRQVAGKNSTFKVNEQTRNKDKNKTQLG